MTFFEVFSLPPRFRIELPVLEKSFYRLSREVHPDRFASRPADEQAEATERSSLLNNAYRTLRDPIRRTEYLLQLEGVELDEQSVKASELARQTGKTKKQVVPPELLEEAFELNMQLEEMKAARAAGQDDPQLRIDLERAQVSFVAMLDQSQKELDTLWKAWDAAADAEDPRAKTAARDAMVALLNKRSYLRNLVRDVNAALE